MDIKILGLGCPRCEETEMILRDAAAEMGLAARIEKVTGAKEIASYGVFGTPAVVVNGEVKSAGKIPKKEEVKAWLHPFSEP